MISGARAQQENRGSVPLTPQQAVIFEHVRRYHETLGEGCPAAHVARRLHLHHETVREHFAALYRKGWLLAGNSPATPRAPFLTSR